MVVQLKVLRVDAAGLVDQKATLLNVFLTEPPLVHAALFRGRHHSNVLGGAQEDLLLRTRRDDDVRQRAHGAWKALVEVRRGEGGRTRVRLGRRRRRRRGGARHTGARVNASVRQPSIGVRRCAAASAGGQVGLRRRGGGERAAQLLLHDVHQRDLAALPRRRGGAHRAAGKGEKEREKGIRSVCRLKWVGVAVLDCMKSCPC